MRPSTARQDDAPGRVAPAWALVVAILLAALNLRTAVSSVGPLLDELEGDIGLSSALAGVLTTVPVISFAVFGALTPRLAHRFGDQRLLAGGLVLMTVGLALRALVASAWPFLLLSVLALAGGAVSNVLLPVLVKRHFADRVGAMTAAYTTSLAVGVTLAAGLTVPLSTSDGVVDWRRGVGMWAVVAAVAAAAWLVLPGGSRAAAAAAQPTERARLPLRGSRTAWALALFFAAQSMQAYIALGWFALFFREEAGASASRAGLLVAVLAAMSIPTSLAVPPLATRMRSQRPMVVVMVVSYLIAYVGMLLAPAGGAWLWVVLTGLGSGAFPLALTMIGLRTRTVGATTALSAFSQSMGYLLAGSGPLLVGVLHGATGGWGLPFVLLFAAVAVMAVAGWYAAAPRFVEDDVPAAQRVPA